MIGSAAFELLREGLSAFPDFDFSVAPAQEKCYTYATLCYRATPIGGITFPDTYGPGIAIGPYYQSFEYADPQFIDKLIDFIIEASAIKVKIKMELENMLA